MQEPMNEGLPPGPDPKEPPVIPGRPLELRYPTPEEERILREDFFRRYPQKIREFIAAKHPSATLTPNQIIGITGYLYGMHLVNHITGDVFFDRDFGVNRLKISPRDHIDASGEYVMGTLSPDNLEDWPIDVINTPPSGETPVWRPTPPYHRPHSRALTSIVSVPLGYFRDADPNTINTIVHQTKKRIRIERPYLTGKATNLEMDIDAGLEEAIHSYQDYWVRKHKVPMRYSDFGKKEDIDRKAHIFRTEGPPLYYAAIGNEFSCFLPRANLVRRYMPEVWQNGYSRLHDAVIQKRRTMVAAQGLPEEPLIYDL